LEDAIEEHLSHIIKEQRNKDEVEDFLYNFTMQDMIKNFTDSLPSPSSKDSTKTTTGPLDQIQQA
jgi:hypothetical protein